jgi:hypothetical protein
MSLGGTPICGAPLRRKEGICKRPAGSGTTHPGEGFCRRHGGLKKAGPKAMLYSKVHSPDTQTLLKAAMELDDPLSLLPEVAFLRAQVVQLANRTHTIDTTLQDVQTLASLLDKVGSMVERVAKREQGQSVTLARVSELMRTLGEHVVFAATESIRSQDERDHLLKVVEARWGIALGDLTSEVRP